MSDDVTIADLRDPEQHLDYAVQLLEMNAGQYIKQGDWDSVMRIWNTGRPNGKTHDPDYVFNAGSVMDAYEELGDVDVDESPPAPPEIPDEFRVLPSPEETKQPPVVDAKAQDTVTVQKVAQSLGSKLMAGGALVTTLITGLVGAFLGIIKNPYAFAILIVGGSALAIYSWNESKNRQMKMQLDLNAKAASKDLNTVVMLPQPPAES